MAGAGGDSLSETPGWRVAVLVAVFIVITLLWEKLSEMVEHHLSSKNRLGLRHVVHKLQEELLALGLISLLLIAVQAQLEKICIKSDDSDYKYDTYGKDKYDTYGEDKDGYEEKTYDGRRLLAGGYPYDCGEGKESFWSVNLMHQAHIFIFTLAVTHIVYAMLSMVICIYKLRRWEKWEKSTNHELREISDKRLLENRNIIVYVYHILTATCMESVDRSVYLGLRRLFIERMNLTDSFNFHQFLVNSMEEEFSKVVKLEWFMWLIVGIWILTPPYLLFIMTGFAIAIMMAVATHLEFIAVKLTNQAFKSYATPPTVIKRPSLLRKSLAKLSARGKKAQTESKECQTVNIGADDVEGVQSQNMDAAAYNEAGGMAAQNETTNGVPGQAPNLSSISMSHDPKPKSRTNDSEVSIDMANNVINGAETGDNNKPSGWAPWTKEKVATSKFDKEMEKQRAKSFAVNYAAQDSAQLFWLSRPRLMLKAVQFTYFETSLLVAILLFNIWQKSDFIISKDIGHPNWLTLVLVIFGLLLMVHSAYFVLPLYALTMAAGSHCPESILKLAKKKKIQPKMVNALERLSYNPKSGNSATSGRADMPEKPLGFDWVDLKADFHGHEEKNQTSLTTLLGAMYKEQTKNFIESQRAQSQQQEAPNAQNTRNSPDRSVSVPVRINPEQPQNNADHIQPFGSFAVEDPSARKADIDGLGNRGQ